jgi:hypothetical protein
MFIPSLSWQIEGGFGIKWLKKGVFRTVSAVRAVLTTSTPPAIDTPVTPPPTTLESCLPLSAAAAADTDQTTLCASCWSPSIFFPSRSSSSARYTARRCSISPVPINAGCSPPPPCRLSKAGSNSGRATNFAPVIAIRPAGQGGAACAAV